MDDADRAADLQEADTQGILLQWHAEHPAALPGSLGRAECLDCQAPIPLEGRRAAPRSGRCIACQKTRDRPFALGC